MSSFRTQALALSIFTVAYNILEGAVGIYGAIISGSSALMGFGLDSFVESLSGSVMIWRFCRHDSGLSAEEFQKIEKTASRLVAYSFFILGTYVVINAGHLLYRHAVPETSLIGILLAVASLVVMPILFYLKYRLGKAIESQSLIADSKETLACVLLSVALLVGLGSYFLWETWWIDPVAALVIAVLVFREGYETLKESRE